MSWLGNYCVTSALAVSRSKLLKITTIKHTSHFHDPGQRFPRFTCFEINFLVTLASKMYPGKNKSEVNVGEQDLSMAKD